MLSNKLSIVSVHYYLKRLGVSQNRAILLLVNLQCSVRKIVRVRASAAPEISASP